MEKIKILEEKSKLDTEILVTLFNEFINADRVNVKLGRNSSWIKGQISKLKKTEYLEEKSNLEKTNKGKPIRIPLLRLKPNFIFYHLDRTKFNEKEKSYLLKLIDKQRKLIAGTTNEEKLYLNTFRVILLILNVTLLGKSTKYKIKSRLIRDLSVEIVFQTIRYREKSDRLRAEWDSFASSLIVLGNLKPEQKRILSITRTPF